MNSQVFQSIAAQFPALKLKLRQAGMKDKPEAFVKKTLVGAAYMSAGLIVSVSLILISVEKFTPLLLLGIPILYVLFFLYMLKLPDVKIKKSEKEVSKEVVFAGRALIIELESGVPLYNALISISRDFKNMGKYLREIIDKVDLGSSLEEALNEEAELIPSEDFRKIIWQLVNAIRTGSDVSRALSTTVDQISKRQAIEVSKYGKKLNPLAMFYMMIAVILPSLGITMLIILSSFIQFELTLTLLIVIAFLLGFVQFMFVSMIKMSRPPVDF